MEQPLETGIVGQIVQEESGKVRHNVHGPLPDTFAQLQSSHQWHDESAMEDLLDKGLIRSIGISNFSYRQTVEAVQAMKRHVVSSTQMSYSLAHRDIEKEILPYCKKENIAVIAYFPLGHGKLAKESSGVNEIIAKRSNHLKPSQVALSLPIQ